MNEGDSFMWRLVWLVLWIAVVSVCLADGACAPMLRLADDEFGDYFYLDADSQPSGFDQAILQEVSRRLGCKLVIEVDSTVRILQRIQLGTADVAGHKIATAERQRAAWMVPYVYNRIHALVSRRANVQGLAGFMADPRLILGVGRAFVHGPGYDRIVAALRAQNRVVEAADIRELVHLFLAGRVQAVILPPMVYLHTIPSDVMAKEINLESWSDEPSPPPCLMLSKARMSIDMARRVADVLDSMRNDGTLLRMLTTYAGPATAQQIVFDSKIEVLSEQ
jgi:polar amino acid transport system substrate-binding protein